MKQYNDSPPYTLYSHPELHYTLLQSINRKLYSNSKCHYKTRRITSYNEEDRKRQPRRKAERNMISMRNKMCVHHVCTNVYTVQHTPVWYAIRSEFK